MIVRTGVAKMQDALALTKPVLIAGLAVLAGGFATRAPATITANFGAALWQGGRPQDMGPSIFAALWAFNGWANLAFMAEEMPNPQRQMPRSIIGGMLIVITIYITCNICYLAVLPAFDGAAASAGGGGGRSLSLATTPVAAVDTAAEAGRLLLPVALAGVPAALVAGFISISGVGSSNVTVMTGGRAFFAVARAGQAPAALARLSRWQTPWVALWAQGAVSIVLCWLPGNSLSALMSGFGVASWVYYLGTALALLKLRRSQPDWARPYRAPMACVWACVAASVLLVASTFFSQPLPTLMALCCCALAWPARWALAACGCLGKG